MLCSFFPVSRFQYKFFRFWPGSNVWVLLSFQVWWLASIEKKLPKTFFFDANIEMRISITVMSRIQINKIWLLLYRYFLLTCTAIDKLTTIWKSDFSDKIKWGFFHATSVLLYGCTIWTLTKCREKRVEVDES